MVSELTKNFMRITWDIPCWHPPTDIPQEALDLINFKLEKVRSLQALLDKELMMSSFSFPDRPGRYVGAYFSVQRLYGGPIKFRLLQQNLHDEVIKLEKEWLDIFEKIKSLCGCEIEWLPNPKDLRNLFSVELGIINPDCI